MLKDLFLKLIRKYSNNENYNSECWSEIENKYSSKTRHYHNLNHLKNMITELRNVESQVENLDTLLFAIYYHDIIYNPAKSDNEHQSALLFNKRISETSFANLQECMALIDSTKEHKLSKDKDTNILLDIDLSTLGKSTYEYKEYCENIRKEYQMYSDAAYCKGRKEVIMNILELDSIYKTAFFKQEYENQAKENLRNELRQLKS